MSQVKTPIINALRELVTVLARRGGAPAYIALDAPAFKAFAQEVSALAGPSLAPAATAGDAVRLHGIGLSKAVQLHGFFGPFWVLLEPDAPASDAVRREKPQESET